MTERPDPIDPAPSGNRRGRGGRLALYAALALVLGGAAGFAGVYGIGGGLRNADAPAGAAGPVRVAAGEAGGVDDQASPAAGEAGQCSRAGEVARKLSDLAKGELAAFAPTLKPTRIPDLAVIAPDGTATRLGGIGGDGLRLVNIWATWCVPCRTEMPALDTLQAERGGNGFEVVAINIDTRDGEKPKRFYEETGIRNLALYTDPKAKAFQDLRAVGRGFGLPTTMLIDAEGCEIGHIAGPAEWASPEALALIDTAKAAYATR
ncbi:thiol:disulfide interchange protein TlpA [Ancylobacter oerskovii]|uniref:TlpA disulfide reductase family protein n=1 Tax=Ancylobacter oerskovii TaxID=459519 RepID=A0ABW4YU87_9HYPH|nr:TlpA disulfide reductase family protein [Ancylobacter oerskovii]MBS7543736.1 TlpA family protein disulfide reductase [Ancylobacter oerskovii]